MRLIAIALILLFSVPVAAGAQKTNQCSSDTLEYRGLRRLLEDLTTPVAIAASRDVRPRSVAATPTRSPVVRSTSVTAATSYSLLTNATACSRLRSAVATRESIQSQGVNLTTVHWTFVDLGTRYGVLLTTKVNPTLGLEVSQRSPFYLFTKDIKPVYLQLIFP